jgi:HAD superfamily hydrolase (TIGR01509 family)
MSLRALIFDVDGTLAETEEIHRAAFNQAFAEAGLPWVWGQELYGRLLRVTGGRERIAAYAQGCATAIPDIPALHRRKTEIFNDALRRGAVSLRPGVQELLGAARSRGLWLAIATTTRRPNVLGLVQATLGGTAIAWFASVRTGEDVARKKPDPQVYLRVLADLDLPAKACLAFEDSEHGLRAAQAAGIAAMVTPSLYTQNEHFGGAAQVLRDLATFGLQSEL